MRLNGNFQPLLRKKHAQPICWVDDSTLVYYWRGHFASFDIESKKDKPIGIMPLSFGERILSLFSATRRLFRLYIFSPAFDKNKQEILFSFNGYFWSFNLKTLDFCREQKLNHKARRLLSICISKSGDAYYGEYPTRNDNQSVCIYKRDHNQRHSIVYRFKPGEIRHIHLIAERNDDLFCFTGDENDETKVLRFVKQDFSIEPKRILSGKQDYRSCVAAFKNECLYYLTDNPYFANKLFVYNLEKDSFIRSFSVEGSVVYGLSSEDHIFFSTCVEYNLAKDEYGNNVRIKIDGSAGGIRSNQSVLYCFDIKNNALKDLMRIKKDRLPIKYFGFGTLMFTCNASSKYLASFSHSLKRSETLYIFDINTI